MAAIAEHGTGVLSKEQPGRCVENLLLDSSNFAILCIYAVYRCI